QDELEKSHREAVQKIMGWLDEGKNIAFLTLGDPTIYSTYAYVHGKIRDKGYETEIIPGIPSFCAVAARLNESLTEAGEALVVIPGSYQGVEEALAIKGTKVLMKSGKAMGSIKRYLKNMEKPPTVKMVERCGMEGERIFHTIEELDENASYFSLMIVRDK
ncbi:MAG: precorrin-2 C(20)-methyltransferase, partial [Anaerovorax sp.]